MSDPTPRPSAHTSSLRLFALLGLGAVSVALAAGLAPDAPGAKPEETRAGVTAVSEPAPGPKAHEGPFGGQAIFAQPPAATPKETTIGGKAIFADWPKGKKPDAVLVLSGQTFGYLQPCGCSRPQTGGLERRAYFMNTLREKGWPVAGVDLGDMSPEKVAVREQGRLKYIATMNALREMGYIAVGVGETELQAGLDMLLGAYIAQKEQPPFTLAGNAVGLGEVGPNGKPKIVPRLQRFPVIPGDTRPLVGLTEVTGVGSVPVSVTGVVGTPLALEAREKKWDTSIDFGPPQDALKEAQAALAKNPKKPQLNVLIYQGGAADAAAVAKDFPLFNVILCQATDALPPLRAKMVNVPGGKTAIVEVGHKGQHVGVIGAFKKPGGGFDLEYQLVPLGEEFDTPGTEKEALKANKALQSLQNYAESVKAEIRLGKDYPRVPHPAQIHAAGFQPKVALRYVGSDACKGCHAAEFKKWAEVEGPAHSHAMEALEKLAKRPNLRQFDGECVKCHTVGFDYQTGYEDDKKTPHLRNVGCESCHGPGSGHVAQPKNKQFTELLSLWKQGIQPAAPGQAVKMPDNAFMDKMAKLGPEERGKQAIAPAVQLVVNRVSGMCMNCHNLDADPHFDLYKYWSKLGHSGLAPPGGWPAVAPQK